MNGKLVRKLRKIAHALELEPKTKYVPTARHLKCTCLSCEDRRHSDVDTLPPHVMHECVRKAYKEAKRIYRGLPPTALEPK